MADDKDNPGIRVSQPLIYVLPLIPGLLLDRRSHVPFLPHRLARGLGWSLIGGGVAFNGGWFLRTLREAEVPLRTDRPVPRLTTDGPFRYSRNPSYLSLAMVYAGIAVRRICSLGHPPSAYGAGRDPGRGDRPRGALPGADVGRRVSGLRGAGTPLGVTG